MGHRAFKKRIYPEFARIARAMASDKRLELLDLLAQGPRHVEALAAETEMSVANVSQHLQVLRGAKLVEADRSGNRVVYCLAGPDVVRLWLGLRAVAEHRIPEVAETMRAFAIAGAEGPAMAFGQLRAGLGEHRVVLIDVRPIEEFQAGHIPGAISMPLDEVAARAGELPRDRRIVAYCRGEYCLSADEAVATLRGLGFEALRLEGGWPEWSTSLE